MEQNHFYVFDFAILQVRVVHFSWFLLLINSFARTDNTFMRSKAQLCKYVLLCYYFFEYIMVCSRLNLHILGLISFCNFLVLDRLMDF